MGRIETQIDERFSEAPDGRILYHDLLRTHSIAPEHAERVRDRLIQTTRVQERLVQGTLTLSLVILIVSGLPNALLTLAGGMMAMGFWVWFRKLALDGVLWEAQPIERAAPARVFVRRSAKTVGVCDSALSFVFSLLLFAATLYLFFSSIARGRPGLNLSSLLMAFPALILGAITLYCAAGVWYALHPAAAEEDSGAGN